MVILKIKEQGHTVSMSGHTFRTPAFVDITNLNERMIKIELQKHGISRYSIEFIPDEQIKKDPGLIKHFSDSSTEKEEKKLPNNEQIENRLLSIESLLKQLLEKKAIEHVIYTEKLGKDISKEIKTIEEDVGFIPSIDIDVKIKGSDIIGKVEKGEIDLDEKSKQLSKFLKK